MNTQKTMKAIAAGMIALSASAYAADDHKGHDHDKKQGVAHTHESKAMHGGVVSVVKDMNYELVAKPNRLELYITDHGKPVDAKDAVATLTLLSAAGKEEVKLLPIGDNQLGGTGSFKTGAGTKALAVITMAGQFPVSVRFALK